MLVICIFLSSSRFTGKCPTGKYKISHPITEIGVDGKCPTAKRLSEENATRKLRIKLRMLFMSNQCISFGDTGFFARVVKEKCKKIAQNLNWKRKEILRKNVSGTIFYASFLRQTNKKDSLSPMSDYVTICRHTLS